MNKRKFLKLLSFLPAAPLVAKAVEEDDIELFAKASAMLDEVEAEASRSSLTKVEQIAWEEACEAFERQNWFGTPKV